MKNGEQTYLLPGYSQVALLLERAQIYGCDLAVAAALSFEENFLTFAERLQTGALNCGDVDKYVGTTLFRLNEAVTLLTVEPLNSAVCNSCLQSLLASPQVIYPEGHQIAQWRRLRAGGSTVLE